MIKKMIYPIAVSIAACLIIYAFSVQKDLSDGIMRLHIISDSNSEFDTMVKLEVRDAIIKEAGDIFKEVKNKKQCRSLFEENKGDIKKIAERVLKENGLEYGASVIIGKMYVPRKIYDGIILPEGSYEGVTVRLGEAKGQNWWCVVYPPLCFTESTSGELSEEAKEYLKSTLPPESYSLISEEGINIEYKFKIVELIQKIKKNF